MPGINLPSWEVTQIQQLSQNNQLSGVNPLIIEAIDQAESSGNPGSPNSAGYGGYFGLSPSATYPGGHVVGGGEGTNSPEELTKEAETAAAEFASLLASAGGDPIQAEYHYQAGGNAQAESDASLISGNFGDGPPIVWGALGGSPTQVGEQVQAASGQGNTQSPASIQLTGIGGTLQALDNVMNPTGGSTITQILTLGGSDVVASVTGLVVRSVFALGFVGVIYFGIKALSSSGGGSGALTAPNPYDVFKDTQQRRQTDTRLSQGQQRLDLGAANTEISRASQGTRQHRADTARQEVSVKASRERRLASKGGKKAAGKASEGAVASALESVGEAAVVL